jgi:hypothetical protein
MMLNPEGFIPAEVDMRTTQARRAFRAQPRRTKKRNRFLRRNRRYTLAA